MSKKMNKDDPVYFLLDNVPPTPKVIHREGCYICEDDEFQRMGLPLCYVCPLCGGHIPADDCVCDDCGHNEHEAINENK